MLRRTIKQHSDVLRDILNRPFEVDIDAVLEALAYKKRYDWSAEQRFSWGMRCAKVHHRRRRVRRAIWSAKHDARPRRAIPTAGRRRRDEILRAMQPGEWHTVREISTMSGVPYRSIQPMLYQRLEPERLVEKAQDAAWRAGDLSSVARTLWRITATGEVARAMAIVLE
jgi:hypothetical protein